MNGKSFMTPFKSPLAGIVFLMAILSGCASVDYRTMREADSGLFIDRLEEKSGEVLPADRLDRKAGVGKFLPVVDLNYSWSSSDPVLIM